MNRQEVTVDLEELLGDLEYLSSDLLKGRAPGTEGSRLAQEYIIERFEMIGVEPFGGSYRHPFEYTAHSTAGEGVNVIGHIPGSVNEGQYLVVTAHYDHLGVIDGEIYNGADDNASGIAGMMAAARWFSEHPPENSIIFIGFDAEEQGLKGSRHFISDPVVPLDRIVMNVNLDMISNNDEDKLYVAGTYHYPFLGPMVASLTATAPINVLFGYDSPEWEQDWTLASDHGPFHLQGIPFIYFGVEDHEHYHRPTDTFENVNPEFFVAVVTVIIGFIRDIDARLDEVREASGREQHLQALPAPTAPQ